MSAAPTSHPERVAIDPGTSMGTVRLTVSDVNRSRDFYERALGLRPTELDDGLVALGTGAGSALLELRGDASAPPLDRRAPGLFHVAVLLPTRVDLAAALARLARAGARLEGASDHLVSEALYLSDPDGNGIEIYRDRPRQEWPVQSGSLQMATLPLDLDSLLGELGDAKEIQRFAPAGTNVGHVHLQVSDLAKAEQFYVGVLGFDVTVRGYPGALFVSAGGYHHHLGLNTWNSAGSPPAAPGAIGLDRFEIVLPTDDALEEALARVHAAGIDVTEAPDGALLRDPFGTRLLLRSG